MKSKGRDTSERRVTALADEISAIRDVLKAGSIESTLDAAKRVAEELRVLSGIVESRDGAHTKLGKAWEDANRALADAKRKVVEAVERAYRLTGYTFDNAIQAIGDLARAKEDVQARFDRYRREVENETFPRWAKKLENAEARAQALKNALQPFAEYADQVDERAGDEAPLWPDDEAEGLIVKGGIHLGAFRQARLALKGKAT